MMTPDTHIQLKHACNTSTPGSERLITESAKAQHERQPAVDPADQSIVSSLQCCQSRCDVLWEEGGDAGQPHTIQSGEHQQQQQQHQLCRKADLMFPPSSVAHPASYDADDCRRVSSACSSGSSSSADADCRPVSSACSSGSSSSSADASSNDAVVITVLDNLGSDDALRSIYALYTPRRVYAIMLVVALAALTAPLSNTIFFPAMKAIQTDLHTTAAAVTSSVATFQIAIGVGALLWGPASDKFGRKPILLIATGLFALTNVPLMLTPNIGLLIAFRTLQGAAISAYASAAPGMTADICSPDNRGTLFGVCSVAALLGPVIGPPIGGGLSQAFGWRSVFALLAALSTLVILPLLVWCVPETLQYKVLQRLGREQPAVSKIAEAQSILGRGPPHFQAPWWPIRLVCDRQMVLHVLTMLLGYAMYLCSLAVLPFYLARAPYNLSTGAIGAAYLPGALAAIVASPCGGKLADLAGRANPQQPLRRLVYGSLLQLLVVPLSVIVLGWGLQCGWHLAFPLIACFLASFMNCLYMPGLFTVLTIVHAGASASAVGAVYALLFLLSGSLMMLGTAVIITLGLGPFLSILAALHFGFTLAGFIQIIRSCNSSVAMPAPLMSRHGSAAFVRSAYRIMATSFKDPQAGVAGIDSSACEGKSVCCCSHAAANSSCVCQQPQAHSKQPEGSLASRG